MALHLHRAEGRRRATRLLFLVHNYGGSEHALATVGTLLDPTGRFAVVCPRGSIATDDVPGGASFYRIDRASHTYDLPSFAAALDGLDESLERACAEGGFERTETVIGGYSQGGGLALALAYRRTTRPRPAAVVAFSPPIHPVERVAWDLQAATTVAAFVTHGHRDRTFPAEASAAFVTALRAAGADAEWHGQEAGHQLTIEALAQARDWLAAH